MVQGERPGGVVSKKERGGAVEWVLVSVSPMLRVAVPCAGR